jgi:hypothetical protein
MEPEARVIQGDCREVMATLDAESVDAIVSDPPYGLSFMGKGWDHSVPGVEFWEAALRVAKPGAHLLAFGGTRLFHRLAVAIEDAGWEIRDTLMWVYGSGFPKSHDVSKAIDKAAGAKREVVETRRVKGGGMEHVNRTNAGMHGYRPDGYQKGENVLDITAPSTDLAKKYAGWGTALKPAWEPIIMARKPLIGTVAANFEKHGVGGLNIDGCRIRALTGQRPSDIIRVWEQEKNLCVSCAGLAAKRAKPRTPETKGIFAEGRVEPTLNGRARDRPRRYRQGGYWMLCWTVPGGTGKRPNLRFQFEHRRVWEEANGPIPDGHEIHHINGDGFDNRFRKLAMPAEVRSPIWPHTQVRERRRTERRIRPPRVRASASSRKVARVT